MLISNSEILNFLTTEDEEEIKQLFTSADKVRQEAKGSTVYLRGIIEFSNYCTRNCSYCGLRRGNLSLKRYRMSEEEIIQCALRAWDLGYQTVVLQSGEDPYFTGSKIAGIITGIKEKSMLNITLSLGERSHQDYALWKKVGADRYLLRHETANPKRYQSLHPDGEYLDRIKCLSWLKELGYEVGAGSMVGLPNQSREDLLRDLKLFQEMEVDMAGIGPFIPHPATPLANEKGGTLRGTLKMVALSRILRPQLNLPATTALGSLDARGREKALECGANVIMPNATPGNYRVLYELYPNKICLDEGPEDCCKCISNKLRVMGRGTDLGLEKRRIEKGNEIHV